MAKWRGQRNKERSVGGHRITKTERELRQLLNSTGLRYSIVAGTKHHRIFIEDKQVGVFNPCTDRHGPLGLHNLTTAIRRGVRQITAQASA